MINILSAETVNKIAAGEVIERPLNVVKELVENSLDACAKNISIEIMQAGAALIRIVDDGIGMDKQDLMNCILRHATSKISNFDDLSQIQSFGFRGEGLSSIAAVCKFSITSKKRGQKEGWKLSSNGGQNIEITPASCNEGTVCEVGDLFFNTPVRKKFLKTQNTEKARILEIIEQIALANYDVSFKFISDSKSIFNFAKTNNKIERIADALEKNLWQKFKTLTIPSPEISIEIFFTDRNNVLDNRKNQFLFVNLRPVSLPKWLIHCINNAYKETIPRDKFPGFLIFITIDPAEIDVNIHPTKREIKFANESKIYDLIISNLRRALLEHAHPALDINKIEESESIIVKPDIPDVSNAEPYYDSKSNAPIKQNDDFIKNQFSQDLQKYKIRQQYNFGDYVKFYKPQTEFTTDFDNTVEVVGQVFCGYIVAQKENDLYVFDQHAAAERIRYEAYTKAIDSHTLKIQPLLIQENFETSASACEILKENLEVLSDLGFSVSEFGDRTFKINAYPTILGAISIEPIIRKILDDIEQNKNIDIKQKREIIIMRSCRESIKAGDALPILEAKKLISDLFKCDNPFTCPHGRPTAWTISKNDLEKFFKRK